jgi:hypothetical protein
LRDKENGGKYNFDLNLKKAAHFSLRINSEINCLKLEMSGSFLQAGINFKPLPSKDTVEFDKIREE